MSTLPDLTFKSSSLYSGKRNDRGQLCNIYTPLQNLADETTKKLGDFTTENLNFDMEHPVDIILQDSYDGAVNMIINDGKNRPRLINSRFSVQDENTFKIPDHSGFKDTNIYDEETFNIDTLLKAIPIKIPIVTYDGLINNGGKLSCGTYTFYFKLADADGNETEVVAESGIVQCHIGEPNSPNSIRMGLQDENSSKAIKFTLSNIDAGFDYIHVLFSRTSSGDDQAAATTYKKIFFDFPVDKNGICNITITGAETIIGISKEECNVDYADINSVKTQVINNNVLLFGNVDTPEHDWDAIKRFTWKIIPRWSQAAEGAIGTLDTNYNERSITIDQIEDHGFCYYNTKNVYYRLGYWPDEIYRFGIVYIFNDNSLSPVINLQGIDFTAVDFPIKKSAHKEWAQEDLKDFSKIEPASDYEQLFFTEDTANKNRKPEYLYEEDGLYFNKKYKTNSRGVIKFPTNIDVKNVKDGVLSPKPLYINFDLSLIGYKYALEASSSGTKWNEGDITPWRDVLKQHNIKGFFFVRQKRIPTILGQGIIIGLTHQLCGALPVIKDDNDKFVVQPFIGQDRLLHEEAEELSISSGQKLFLGKKENTEAIFKNQAMLCPDAEIDEATFNQLFVSNDFILYKQGNYGFSYNSEEHSANINYYSPGFPTKAYKTKLTNVPEDIKTLTNGVDYFSTQAGNPDEPYKTADILHAWKWTEPQYLTVSTSLLRGKWGPFVGLNNPNEKSPINKNCPFNYGEVYNIKTSNYENKETATELDFQKVMNSNASFFAISPRMEMTRSVDCFRGDCYISMFTHRMFRNFIDPELPTNHQIVDPACWQKNYGVRCTATTIQSAHSNLTKDSEGWVINDNKDAAKEGWIQAAVYFLTGNIFGFVAACIQASKTAEAKWDEVGVDSESPHEFGYANEIVQAFEVYIGSVEYNPLNPITNFKSLKFPTYKIGKWEEPTKKKVNPKEQEKSGGFNLKAIFKSDDDWELRGLSGINRADVNAVAMGQWITFPILSNKNLSMRDVDFSNAIEQTSFNKKRSFFPLVAKEMKNPLRDSNVINQASAVSLPDKPYIQLPKVPYFKQEYFTRIQNSLRDSSSSITNEFKIMLESSYHDYTKVYGSITKLESKGNYVFIIFKHGIGILDMAASIAQAQDATQFLPDVQIISDMYGSIWKDSIIQTPYGIYGVDSVAKVIWKIQGTEVKVISDMKVEKFLIDNLDMSEFNFRPYIGHINIKSHYNAFKHDVMFTYYNDLIYEFPYEEQIVDGEKTKTYKYTPSDGYSIDLDGFVVDETGKRYHVDEETQEEVLYGKAIRLLPEYNKIEQKWQSYSDIIKDKKYQWVKGTNWSLCWNEDLQEFQTFFDWIPVDSENIDNIYFSFDRDQIEEVKENTKDHVLIPVFYKVFNVPYPSEKNGEPLQEKKYNMKLGVSQKKNMIDSSFTNDTKIYNIKTVYDPLISFPNSTGTFITRFANDEIINQILPYTINSAKEAVFSCYLRIPSASRSSKKTVTIFLNNDGNIIIHNVVLETSEWVFIPIFIKNTGERETYINSIELKCNVDYYLCEPKIINYIENDITYGPGTVPTQCYPIYKDNGLFKEYYNIRSTDNSMKLWKHGQAGVYDNQGKIKPTNWYGKQHEFNFEFIVNENSSIQKIFNNLKIISNKAEPYKFEYEVVGEAYAWYEYKEIVYWINEKVKNGIFVDPESAYKYVLSNTIGIIKATYKDFPDLFNKDSSYKIPKLPYLEIKLSDKKGLPDKDKSYTKNDKWSNASKTCGEDDYKYNTTETILVEDEQLNEYRIHTEQYGNNMKKYGRVRGNMEYLEDLWNIEIRPITFRWIYLDLEENLIKSDIVEARLRDKYIKVKVRYTGEDLVIIQAIQTMFDYSFA